MLFLGTFDYAMDERGRVPIPPRYRDAFRDGVVLGQGSPDPCVRIYTPEAWDAHSAQYLQQSAMRRRGRVLRRALFASAHPASLDAQNRLLIPGPLRAYAGLDTKVLVVGAGEQIAPGVRVSEIRATHVVLDRGGRMETLELPRRALTPAPAPQAGHR